jgi:glutamyl-tRNA synthetase
MYKFALSSTKDIDINSLYLALLNFVLASKNSKGFTVLVEDLNKKDINETILQNNIEILKKFSLTRDDLLHYQSKNEKIYQNFALKLLQDGNAYACFCNSKICQSNCKELSKSEISMHKEKNREFVIRVNKPKDNIKIKDILQGSIEVDCNKIDSFAILKSSGEPTSEFASTIDNMLMNISTNIAFEKDIEALAKEVYIHNLLNYKNQINYLVISSIKYDFEATIKNLFINGFMPDSIINYIFLLNFKFDKKIFYLPYIVDNLNLESLTKAKTKFELKELKVINKEHLVTMDDKRLSMLFGFADSSIGKVAKLYLDEGGTLNELEANIKALFAPKNCTKELKELVAIIKDAPIFSDFSSFKEYLKDQLSFNDSTLDNLLRELLALNSKSIELSEIYKLINPYLLEVARCQ